MPPGTVQPAVAPPDVGPTLDGPALPEVLGAYVFALEQLDLGCKQGLELRVLRALAARDVIAWHIADARLAPADLRRIVELDERLRSHANNITVAVGPRVLATWRASRQAAPSAWWWALDQVASASANPHPLWAIAAAFCLTVSVTLIGEISRRFLSVGPDLLSTFSVVVQALLAIVAGGALVGFGRAWVDRVFNSLGIQPKFQPSARVGLAFGLVVLVVALRLSLPGIARYYNNQDDFWAFLRGTDRLITDTDPERQVVAAMERYQRAISLDPDYAVAHYNLGSAYEDILEFDKAMVEYRAALRADPLLYPATNNLARLYMSRQTDFADALTLLNPILERARPDTIGDDRVWYALYKNRGWAYLGLGLLDPAEHDLRQALALRPEGAAAHCLMAQVLEAQGKPSVAQGAWESCVRWERGESVEWAWLALARQRVSAGVLP